MNKRLAEILAEVFGLAAADIHPELEQEDIGVWDSLRQMDLVVSLEREYGIALDIQDILQMTSIASITAVLEGKGVELGY